MATGTSGGLLEDSARHAQSVFKHEILRQYMQPVVSMLGSASPGRRLVVLDGFAGRGRYPDGRPASAELILQAIANLRQSREVSAYFVEKADRDYRALARVVEEYRARGLSASALRGEAVEHLDVVLAAAHGVPLFLFLDPCGAGMPFSRLEAVLAGPRRNARPQTEVLLNFSADLSRRAAGVLLAGRADPIVVRMDATCGGTWWREMSRDAASRSAAGSFEVVADSVAQEYARRLARAGSMLQVTVPVRRRLHHQPIYHLVFLTRSRYGLWVFADALGKARQAWLRVLGAVDDDDETEGVLFSRSDDMEWLIESERRQAAKTVAASMRALAGRVGAFKLVDHVLEVYGPAYGVATESAVTAAVRDLRASGELVVLVNASRLRDRVVGRPRA